MLKVDRQFERRGPLYVPRYGADLARPGRRVERYKDRYRPRRFRAALSVIQSISTDNTSGGSCSLSLSGVGSGNSILAVGCSTGAGGTDFSFSGATFSRLVTQSQGNFQLQQWLTGPLSGASYSITGSESGASTMSLALLEIAGLGATQPDVTNNSGAVINNLPVNSGSVTNTVANEIFITAVGAYIPAGTGNFIAPSGYTMQENVHDGYLAVAYKIVSSIGSTNPQWTAATGPQYIYADIVGLSASSTPPFEDDGFQPVASPGDARFVTVY